MMLVSYRDAAERGEPHPDCERSLVERCRPSLTVLEECGMVSLTLSVYVREGCVWSHWLDYADFLKVTALPGKHRASATKAIGEVLDVLEAAISARFQDDEGMDEAESCLLYVSVSKRAATGWGDSLRGDRGNRGQPPRLGTPAALT